MTEKRVLFIAFMFMAVGASVQAQKTAITKEQLPKSAQSFITANFSGQTISYAINDKDYNSNDYDVYLNNGTEIEFDAVGNWKEVDGQNQAIPTGFIPKSIVTYVNSQFPGTKIIKADKNPARYEVKISNGLELVFNSEGSFIHIDD